MIAQQTAANLHVKPGDTISVHRGPRLSPVSLPVGAIIDLPQANSLFQRVGATAQAQPTAPPDNVILLAPHQFATLTAPLAGNVSWQIHAARSHDLPAAPSAAYVAETGTARNLEVALAGGGLVGDNLGAALDAARSDAAYAQILFLFLGAPGAILAGLLTATVAAAGADRRRRDQALLRTRGADAHQITTLAATEAVVVSVAGALIRLGIAAGLVRADPVAAGLPATLYLPWFAGAAAAGVVIGLVSVLVPVRHDLRHRSIVGARAAAPATVRPWFLRYYLDLLLLAGSAAVFWAAAQSKYSLVLAPEGVPTIKVSYWALAAPVLLWVGGALLIWRVTAVVLHHGRRPLTAAARPLAGPLAPTVVAGLRRQTGSIAWTAVLLALATSFAVSTAAFNTTYQAQAEIDARLTNGADVAVTQPGNDTALTATTPRLQNLPDVRSVEPLQHRYAYVGADLQDLYGVRPGTIAAATSLQDAYFSGGTVTQLMDRLAAQPDGILVSQETVTDFQLVPGDHLRLRLPDTRTGTTATVSFTYLGIAKEFPTAPSDSFLVANADYVAASTHNPAAGTLLIDTGGQHTAGTASDVQKIVGPGGHVTDISTIRGTIGSSLTAVSLHTLTRTELAAAILLAIAASGLVLGLGWNERRRNHAIAALLGARGRDLSGFLTVEAALVTVIGLGTGLLLGAALSHTLTTVLTGVFDPPPAALTIPWRYLALLLCAAATAAIAAAAIFTRRALTAPVSILRDV